MKKLRDVETPLANFFASGVLALGPTLGPVLWQLPPNLAFDAGRLRAFLDLLPRTTSAAAALATSHDERMEGRAWTTTRADAPLRHALEVRHASFDDARAGTALVDLLGEQSVALVVADTAGKWPFLQHVTTDFAYARLHGESELYTSGYDEAALRVWAERVRAWTTRGLDAFVYFDNDVKVRAPFDAIRFSEILSR